MNQIGEGSFATVHLATKREEDGTLTKYAVKVFDKRSLKKKRNWKKVEGKMVMTNALQSVEREVALMKKLKHPNICALHEVIDDVDNQTLYLILDLVEKGQVMEYDGETHSYKTKGGGVVGEETAKLYFRDLVQGMEYLHSHLVAHRDLKPENLLIGSDNTLKIADFGVANIFDGITKAVEGDVGGATSLLRGAGIITNTEGTFHFMAPECGEDREFSAYEVDIWAMGVCLYCFLFGQLPFWTENTTEIFDVIRKKEVEIPLTCSPGLKGLLLGLLEKNPKERLTLAGIKHNPWLTDNDSVTLGSVTNIIKREDITEKEVQSAFTKTSKALLFVTTKIKAKFDHARASLKDRSPRTLLKDGKERSPRAQSYSTPGGEKGSPLLGAGVPPVPTLRPFPRSADFALAPLPDDVTTDDVNFTLTDWKDSPGLPPPKIGIRTEISPPLSDAEFSPVASTTDPAKRRKSVRDSCSVS